MEKTRSVCLLGDVLPTPFLEEVKQEGDRFVFRGGVLYRHPGMVPMLELEGTHYEMGLQYGTLLHAELKQYLADLEQVFRWLMGRQQGTIEEMLESFTRQTLNILSRLPERFVDELKGVAEATGLSLEQAALPALMYDVQMSMGCTGVLMRTAAGGVIHGRNNDTSSFGGEKVNSSTVIVRHKAPGYHTVTHIDFPLFMGVETGYNDQGLTFSEETLNVTQPNPDGHSLIYLIRAIMEECGSLDELPAYFDRYPVVGAYGTVWSDRKRGRGMVAELTPSAWAPIEMKEPLLWNYNHLYSAQLQPQQKQRTNLNPDLDRESVARAYRQKPDYTVDDALDFLGAQMGEDGLDYSHCGMRTAVCNKSASQAVVFDPVSLDFYLGTGVYYAARQNIYRVFEDFSRPPELYRPALPMKPAAVEAARIHNLLLDAAGYRDAYQQLSRRYNDDPQVHFLTAYYSLLSHTLPEYAAHAHTACRLAPRVGAYRVLSGAAHYLCGDPLSAVQQLEALQLDEIDRPLEVLRLYVLHKALQAVHPDESIRYMDQLTRLLADCGAPDFLDQSWKPLLEPASVPA